MLQGMDTNHMAIARAAPSGPITSQNRKQPMRITMSGYFRLGTHGLRSRHVVMCTRLSGEGRTSCSTTRFHCCTIWVRVKWNWRVAGADGGRYVRLMIPFMIIPSCRQKDGDGVNSRGSPKSCCSANKRRGGEVQVL